MKKILLPTIMISLLIFGSCQEEAPRKEIIRPVKAIQVQGLDHLIRKSFPAVTQVTREVELSFRVPGNLIQYNVEEVGQIIQKGQLISEIDPRDFKVNLIAREARYVQAKAEKERFEILYEKGSIAKNDLDIKIAAFLEASSVFENAKNELKDTKVFAPFTGVVGKKLIENFQDVSAKQVIMTLVDLDVLEVLLHIPENLAINFRQFDKYLVEFETYPGKKFNATLKEIGKTPEPAGFPLTLFLDYKIEPQSEFVIAPGFTCKVNIKLKEDEDSSSDIIIIPVTSVFEGEIDSNTAVWILDADLMTVAKRYVIIKNFYSNNSVQISDGLSPGEWIVTAGTHRLNEGQKVKFLRKKL